MTENNGLINGKMITIYPRDYTEFIDLLFKLEKIKEIHCSDFIYIKGDFQYKNTCIFYRKFEVNSNGEHC